MSVMTGICPKCGTRYYGWALNNPLEQKCEECSSKLEISDGMENMKVYHPLFKYPKYEITFNKTKEMTMAN